MNCSRGYLFRLTALIVLLSLAPLHARGDAGSALLAGRLKDRLSRRSPGTAAAGQSHAAPCTSWISPLGKPKACLLCIHGLGLHSKSYEHFARGVSRRGLAVFAIDVRGFGAWMNAQGRAKMDFDACLEDVRVALQSIRKAYPDLPVFLLGESMGGAIALRAASMYPQLMNGLISSVPAEERFKQGKTDLKVALGFLRGPNRDLNIGRDIVNQATGDRALRKDWKKDPLARMKISPKELVQFQKFMNENHDSARKITSLPVLFVQGTNDKLVKPEGTWELFNQLGTPDKMFLSVPAEHLIFEEAQSQSPELLRQNMLMVAAWLLNKVGMKGPLRVASRPARANSGPARRLGPRQGVDPRKAVAEIEARLAQNPGDPRLRFLLGKAYQRAGDLKSARRNLVQAVRGGGAMSRVEANRLLISMVREGTQAGDLQGPRRNNRRRPFRKRRMRDRGPGGARMQGTESGGGRLYPDLSRGKPTVVAFYAKWCEQCRGMHDSIGKLEASFGNRLRILKVDIDDGINQQLADRLDVGPIPTVLFLSANGSVSSTLIGEASVQNYMRGARAIVRRDSVRRREGP